MDVVTGTYEELLLGYTLVQEEEGYRLEQSFTDHSHTGCIKCLAVSENKVLVSGSTDENIHIFNLRTRKDYGTLMQHTGSLTWLEFFHNSHLFSTSEDGNLCVWKVAGWEPMRTFKGHKGGINCVSVHPSGKLALTVGQDHTLRTWNLISGRPAFTSNIKHVADLVVWSPSGDYYAVSSNIAISIYKVEDCQVHQSIQATGRICAITFLTEEVLAYGGEGGVIYFSNPISGKELHQIKTDTNRIRGLAVSPSHAKPSSGNIWLTSASSDGHIKVYDIHIEECTITSQLIVSHDTKFRLTCVATSRPPRNLGESSSEKTSVTKVIKRKQQLRIKDKGCNSRDIQKLDPNSLDKKDQVTADKDQVTANKTEKSVQKKKRKAESVQDSSASKKKSNKSGDQKSPWKKINRKKSKAEKDRMN